jgi:hypothetical protein
MLPGGFRRHAQILQNARLIKHAQRYCLYVRRQFATSLPLPDQFRFGISEVLVQDSS